MYLLTNERYITSQTEFLFDRLGHAQGGGGTWGYHGGLGGQKNFFPEIQTDLVCDLLT